MLTGIICVWSETVKFALTFDVHKNMEVLRICIDVICSQIPLLILVTHSSFNFLLIKSFWRQKEKKTLASQILHNHSVNKADQKSFEEK